MYNLLVCVYDNKKICTDLDETLPIKRLWTNLEGYWFWAIGGQILDPLPTPIPFNNIFIRVDQVQKSTQNRKRKKQQLTIKKQQTTCQQTHTQSPFTVPGNEQALTHLDLGLLDAPYLSQ